MSVENKEDVASMREAAIMQELESYGIDTKAFLVAALKKARVEILHPVVQTKMMTTETTAGTSSSSTAINSNSRRSSRQTTGRQKRTEDQDRRREERPQEELKACSKLNASELERERNDRSFDSSSPGARVGGVQKRRQTDDVDYAEYADAEILIGDPVDPRTIEQQQQTSSNPFGKGDIHFMKRVVKTPRRKILKKSAKSQRLSHGLARAALASIWLYFQVKT